MTREQANRLLSRLKAGEIDLGIEEITAALRATGDLGVAEMEEKPENIP